MTTMVTVFAVIAGPLLVAWVLLGATDGAGPILAERRDRRREHRAGRLLAERSAACLFGLVAAGLLVGALVVLWETKPG